MPIKWFKEKCISCSLCTVLCPFEVFKEKNENIVYYSSKCVSCEECLARAGCPRRAIR